MAKKRKIRWDRVFYVFGPIVLVILILLISCNQDSASDESSLDTVSSSVVTTQSGGAESAANTEDEFVVVIDPGHGGEDTGTNDAAATRFEKDDNLRLGLAVRDALLKYPHVRVLMTRETDVFVQLQERCDIANNADADLFLSLHRNSATDGSGIEIWVSNSSSGDNTMDKAFAQYIMELLKQKGISEDRGIREGFRNSEGIDGDNGDNYYVNINTNMPSCLVEMGFMTSAEDNANFDAHLLDYAAAFAEAITDFGADKGLYSKTAA